MQFLFLFQYVIIDLKYIQFAHKSWIHHWVKKKEKSLQKYRKRNSYLSPSVSNIKEKRNEIDTGDEYISFFPSPNGKKNVPVTQPDWLGLVRVGGFPFYISPTRLDSLFLSHDTKTWCIPWNAIGDGTPTRRRVRRLRQIARGKFENVAHRLLPLHTFAKFRFLDASNAPLSNVSLTRVVDSNEIEIVTR